MKMPHYNVEHNGKYYVFSSICDAFVEQFNTFEELQEYRRVQYGLANFQNEKTFAELHANKMEFKETIVPMISSGNVERDEIAQHFSELNEQEKNEVFKWVLEYIEQIERTK